ncbi:MULTISPECIES: MlaD family protein [unclassified Barnesiella]|uniref:MlaD family protein n=1 Tax=unclassified Barnesiella TaxID=2645177 RepID=UPI000B3AA171|nr:MULTISPECIES: MlaD family protein [unclassified Barnesiella]MCR8911079.1 MlaD family protein [Barnesiella sp. ET7]OUO99585.1 mammalian cell entry protein [Barnesiella sp. An22]HJB73849.1 MCE family protein [Candidatus Barnesiella merdigallinarum]
MKKWFGKEAKIALSVLISILILYVGINYLKGINVMKPSNYYYVQFPSVGGLAQSAPVMIDGYKVGLVQEIVYDYDTNQTIKVLLNLDKKLKIPVDSRVYLETDMLGTSSVVIDLNPHVSEYYEHGALLQGEVKSGLMQSLQSELLPQVVVLLPKLDSILSGLQTLVNDPALVSSVKRLDRITANLERSSVQLSGMMQNDVPVILDNVQGITAQINQFSDTLNALPLQSTMASVQKTSYNLQQITSRLTSPDNSLGLLLNDRGLYDRANGVLGSVDSLMIDLRLNPKRYVHFSLF